MRDYSPLESLRLSYDPSLPSVLQLGEKLVAVAAEDIPLDPEIASLFPAMGTGALVRFEPGEQQGKPLHRIGVVFSGGPAAGGHNVIWGILQALRRLSPQGEVWGFLGGPAGMVEGRVQKLTEAHVAAYRNMGGFDLLGSGRMKLESEAQWAAALQTLSALQIDGLVVVGGDDSNTNAAFMAEWFAAQGSPIRVVGVPKTIDGDLKNPWVEVSFGFDTACKTYSESIGNIARDALSARKYYHFIKLMGRSASHVALECALQTYPNITLLSEEVSHKRLSLRQIVTFLADSIIRRGDLGKQHGVLLIPEGLVESIPEMGTLIQELNTLGTQSREQMVEKLSPSALATFQTLPPVYREQFLLDRDPHGNVQVSHIATEQLLLELVHAELQVRRPSLPFHPVAHFLGYEGRSPFPSNFDAQYCYALGHIAVALIQAGKTGYMAAVRGLAKPPSQWEAWGVPLAPLLHFEMRKGERKAVIQKHLVPLNGVPFQWFVSHRKAWIEEDYYRFPGPIQFTGPSEVCDSIPRSLRMEAGLLASSS